MQLEIGLKPLRKLALNNCNQILDGWKVGIVRAQMTRQLPYSFYWIQVRTVGREKIQLQNMSILVEPGPQPLRMVPPCVVEHHYQFLSTTTPSQQTPQKYLKTCGIESFGQHRHHSSIGRTNCAKNAHLLASGGMQHYRIQIFRRNPHGTA